MNYTVPYKTKQFLVVLIKFSIVTGAFYFIFRKLSDYNIQEFYHFVNPLREQDLLLAWPVLIVLGLSCANWTFEILKWKFLVEPVQGVSLADAFKQSMAGCTASLATPNRIGDYGAKILYYPLHLRKKIALLNLLGHMGQMSVTTAFGVIGLLLYTAQYDTIFNTHMNISGMFLSVIIAIIVMGVLVHKKIAIRGFSLNQILRFASGLPIKTYVRTLGFSIIRYLIFSFQFYYLLLLCGAELFYSEAMVLIASMYFLASLIPAFTFFDVAVKGSMAILVFAVVDISELTILYISTIMWLLNFALPSIVGSYYVLNFKVKVAGV
jgi:hypothetical protein